MNDLLMQIPLDRLQLSARNVRRTGGQDIDELAASIAAQGLLQNLILEDPDHQACNGAPLGVIAGGRRLRALQRLASEHRLPEDCANGIWCLVVSDRDRIEEISLAENTVRESMHPHDEYVALRDMAARGATIETIAARFGLTPIGVRQRLRLANVSPVLLRLFRDDKADLDQLMALAITDDHAAQERVWEAGATHAWMRNPSNLRAALTQGSIASTDKRAQLVGLEAYERAGGVVTRDLFRPECYLADAALLDSLVGEHLTEVERGLRAEGWSFVRVTPDRPHELLMESGRSQPQISADAKIEAAALRERLQNAEEALQRFEESEQLLPDADQAEAALQEQVDIVRDALEHFLAANETYTDRQKAKAGAVAWISNAGRVEIMRGVIPATPKSKKEAGKGAEASDTKTNAPAPEPSRVMYRRLSMHRTIAMQCALLQHVEKSLALLANALLAPLLYDDRGRSALNALRVSATDHRPSLRTSGFPDVDSSEHFKLADLAVSEILGDLKVPARPEHLLGWLLLQPRAVVTDLLALVAVLTIDCTTDTADDPAGNKVAEALDLNMADYWQPDAERFTGLVHRDLTVEAIREVCGKAEADKAAGMKRADLIPHAAHLLHKSGWLPKPLRRPGYALRKADAEADQATAKPKRAGKAKAPAKTTPKPARKAAAKAKPKATAAKKKAPKAKARATTRSKAA